MICHTYLKLHKHSCRALQRFVLVFIYLFLWKMPVKLYGVMGSPPVRAVILTLKALNVPYDLVHLNLTQGEHLSEEYLKLNPQHTIPTLVDDDGFVIWESHAINAYLVNKYGENDKLYPKNPKARAIVDQRLHFDSSVLFILFRATAKNIFRKKTVTKVTDDLKKFIEKGYDFLEKFLIGNQYIAGNDVTIADFSVITSLSNLCTFIPVNSEKFPLLTMYVKRCEANVLHLMEQEEEAKQMSRDLMKAVNFEF